MKLIKISHGFLISNSTQIKSDLLGAIELSKNNPKVTFNLICVFSGNGDFASSYEQGVLPSNLNVVRYPCNREFDLSFALVNYLFKVNLKYFHILTPKLNVKLSRYRLIKNKALSEIKLNGTLTGIIIQKDAFISLHKEDINAATLIHQLVG